MAERLAMAEHVADVLLEAQARSDLAGRAVQRGDVHVADLAITAEGRLDELLGVELSAAIRRAMLCSDPAGALATFSAEAVRAFSAVFVEMLEVVAYLTHQASQGFHVSDAAVLRQMVDDFRAVDGRPGGIRG